MLTLVPAIAGFVLIAAQVASTEAASLVDFRSSSSVLHRFLARQDTTLDPSDIPTQCQSACTSIINTLNTCLTDTCLCTTTNGQNLEGCMNCLVALAPTDAQIEQGQSVLDGFEAECSGFQVGSLTISQATSATASAGGAGSSTAAIATRTSISAGGSTAVLGSATGAQATVTRAGSTSTSTASTDNPLAQNGAVGLRGSSVVLVVAAVMIGSVVAII